MTDLLPGTADQKLIEYFFTFRYSLDMVKDDWTPPRYCRPEYYQNVLYSDLAWTWWKMIDLHPGTADQNLT